jgi:hypothetical protein
MPKVPKIEKFSGAFCNSVGGAEIDRFLHLQPPKPHPLPPTPCFQCLTDKNR